MLFEVLVFLSLIAKVDSVYCSKYNSLSGIYYSSCSGYCSGSYGYQTCNYYYYYYLYDYTTLTGGAIAGIVVGVLVGVAIVVALLVVCIKSQTTVRRNVGTVGVPHAGGANIAVVNTASTGYNQPFQYAPPQQYGYQNPQQTSMAYPPVGPQYNPTYGYMPQPSM